MTLRNELYFVYRKKAIIVGRMRTAMNGPTVVVKDLVKRYGSFTAVDSINFDVKPGEVFGLLGPNGAGKPARWSASRA
jgi:ABC-type uncharacterized transport system ATPase subunit